MSSAGLLPDELEEHAHMLGAMCIHWAFLELELDSWLAVLIPLGPSPIYDIVTTEIDFRGKLAVVKNLAYQKALSPGWFEEVRAILDDIDNNLRPARNRNIHDLWLAQGHKDYPTRMTRTVKLQKAPSTGELKMVINPQAPMPLGELIVTQTDIAVAGARLRYFRGQWMQAQPQPSPDTPPQQSPDP